MVRHLPWVPLRTLGAICTIGGFYLVALAWTHFQEVPAHHVKPTGALVGTIIVALFAEGLALWLVVFGTRRRHLEVMRLAAAQGDPTISQVPIQPLLPPHGLLTLPMTIRMRPRWRALFVYWVLSVGATYVLAAGYSLTTPGSLQSNFLLIAAIIPIFALLFGLLLFGEAHQQLTVTEDGLKIGITPSASQVVPWKEATLFAIWLLGPKDSAPLCYEVASPTASVRWIRYRRDMPLLLFDLKAATKPAISVEDYERDMDALLILIRERTGLPLYDLR